MVAEPDSGGRSVDAQSRKSSFNAFAEAGMDNEARNEPQRVEKQPDYEAPQVEQVMGADEIAREVHYAGVDVSPGQTG
jgi:hypothetical protein